VVGVGRGGRGPRPPPPTPKPPTPNPQSPLLLINDFILIKNIIYIYKYIKIINNYKVIIIKVKTKNKKIFHSFLNIFILYL